MIGVGLFLVGVALLVVSVVVLFGPVAGVVAGPALMLMGLLWPEGVTRGESSPAPPRD